MIETRLTQQLGIEHPIIQAGMGYVARWELTAAVSNAGGLGVLGGALMSPEDIRKEIRLVKDHTDKPWAVDLLLAAGTPMLDEVMEVVFEENPPVFLSGLGDPGPWSGRMHDAGMTVIALVGSVRQATRCAESGVDIIVAQGHEAGGHTGRIPTLVLVPQVVDAIDPVPVVAAGGIGDGRGLAAALMLGAEGALIGTRFIASAEAHCHDNFKSKLCEIGANGTIVSRSYTGKPCRVVRNKHTEEWESLQDKIQPFPKQMAVVGERMETGMYQGDMDYGLAPAGQVAGMIDDLPTAKEIVDRIAAEAEALLSKSPSYCKTTSGT